jgi:hypothetical protein
MLIYHQKYNCLEVQKLFTAIAVFIVNVFVLQICLFNINPNYKMLPEKDIRMGL